MSANTLLFWKHLEPFTAEKRRERALVTDQKPEQGFWVHSDKRGNICCVLGVVQRVGLVVFHSFVWLWSFVLSSVGAVVGCSKHTHRVIICSSWGVSAVKNSDTNPKRPQKCKE